ncbi:MAG TPA: hypothetical protein VK178_11375 [Opitutaceae bacterium]|nr:hypothetical protein [Opitutaceae bacterium]
MAIELYFILGSAGARRRAVLADLLEGLLPTDRGAVLLSDAETPDTAGDAALVKSGATVARWHWAKPEMEFEVPVEATHLFLVADGRANPVDQVEAVRELLLMRADLRLARVLFVADAALLHAHPELQPWYDACAHYADVVVLTKPEGLPQKWVGAFEKRYREQYFPFLFEVLRREQLKNPAAMLVPEARRVAQVFDEDIALADESDEEIEAAMAENDKYFARTRGGSRVEHIPDIAAHLPPSR